MKYKNDFARVMKIHKIEVDESKKIVNVPEPAFIIMNKNSDTILWEIKTFFLHKHFTINSVIPAE